MRAWAKLLWGFWGSGWLVLTAHANLCNPDFQVQYPAPEKELLAELQRSANPSIRVLYQLSEGEGRRFLRSGELAEIRGAYAGAGSAKEKAKKAFNVYLKARLADLTSSEAQKVQAIVEATFAAVRMLESRPDLAAFAAKSYYCGFNPDTGRVQWQIPTAYQETALAYALLVHEIEHVIQWMMLGRVIGSAPMKFIERRFLMALGAMKAEGEFLLEIPAEVRQELLIAIEREVESDFRETAVPMLKAGTPSPEAYVIWQWNQHRYSRLHVTAMNMLSRDEP